MTDERKMPEETRDESLPWDKLRDTGLLWAINRYLLHPRGYALGFHFEDEAAEGEAVGFSLVGDGREPFVFSSKQDDVGLRLFEYFLTTRRPDPHAKAAIAEAIKPEPASSWVPIPAMGVIESARIILGRLESGEAILEHDRTLLRETLGLFDRSIPEAKPGEGGEAE